MLQTHASNITSSNINFNSSYNYTGCSFKYNALLLQELHCKKWKLYSIYRLDIALIFFSVLWCQLTTHLHNRSEESLQTGMVATYMLIEGETNLAKTIYKISLSDIALREKSIWFVKETCIKKQLLKIELKWLWNF